MPGQKTATLLLSCRNLMILIEWWSTSFTVNSCGAGALVANSLYYFLVHLHRIRWGCWTQSNYRHLWWKDEPLATCGFSPLHPVVKWYDQYHPSVQLEDWQTLLHCKWEVLSSLLQCFSSWVLGCKPKLWSQQDDQQFVDPFFVLLHNGILLYLDNLCTPCSRICG